MAFPQDGSALEAVLQADLDHPHDIHIGQVVVADAGPVLVIQRRSRQVGIAGGQRLGGVERNGSPRVSL